MLCVYDFAMLHFTTVRFRLGVATLFLALIAFGCAGPSVTQDLPEASQISIVDVLDTDLKRVTLTIKQVRIPTVREGLHNICGPFDEIRLVVRMTDGVNDMRTILPSLSDSALDLEIGESTDLALNEMTFVAGSEPIRLEILGIEAAAAVEWESLAGIVANLTDQPLHVQVDEWVNFSPIGVHTRSLEGPELGGSFVVGAPDLDMMFDIAVDGVVPDRFSRGRVIPSPTSTPVGGIVCQ